MRIVGCIISDIQFGGVLSTEMLNSLPEYPEGAMVLWSSRALRVLQWEMLQHPTSHQAVALLLLTYYCTLTIVSGEPIFSRHSSSIILLLFCRVSHFSSSSKIIIKEDQLPGCNVAMAKTFSLGIKQGYVKLPSYPRHGSDMTKTFTNLTRYRNAKHQNHIEPTEQNHVFPTTEDGEESSFLTFNLPNLPKIP